MQHNIITKRLSQISKNMATPTKLYIDKHDTNLQTVVSAVISVLTLKNMVKIFQLLSFCF